MKIKYTIIFIMLLIFNVGHAHEPLYGYGPHVLFKGGFAPHITQQWYSDELEVEYALGYGITRKWTMVAETPWIIKNENISYGGINLKSKYRFWLKNEFGYSHQASFISKLEMPEQNGQPTVLNLAFTVGKEALKLYWFTSAGYAFKFSSENFMPGNHILYNVSIAYRPFKIDYYKPDIVFFVETAGNIYQKSLLESEKVIKSGGSDIAVAPTFFFTYRNFALRGGVQFGVWNSTYVTKPESNYKLTFELHI